MENRNIDIKKYTKIADVSNISKIRFLSLDLNI